MMRPMSEEDDVAPSQAPDPLSQAQAMAPLPGPSPWAAVAVSLVVFAALALSCSRLGVTWDEMFYLTGAERIGAWGTLLGQDPGAALGRDVLEEALHLRELKADHPPGVKLLGLSGLVSLPRSWPFYLRARLPGVALFALTLGLCFHVLRRRWGAGVALGAVLGVVGQPRVLGHASLFTTDAPLACLFVLALLALAECERTSARVRRWLVLLYVCVGAAFLVKVTALVLLPVLFGWCVIRRRRDLLRHCAQAASLGVALFVLVYPAWTLFADAPAQLTFLTRPHASYFLGTYYTEGQPPAYWLPVMLVVVTPPGVALALLLGPLGLVTRARRDPLAGLLVWAVVCWGLLFALPFTPRHDGIRQALFWFVTAGLAGGAGLVLAGQGLLARWSSTERSEPAASSQQRSASGWALAVLLLLPASGLLSAAHAHPFLLSTYSAAVGGPAGASELGFDATYYLDAVTPAVRTALNVELPPGAHLAEPYSGVYVSFLQSHGLLRTDIVADSQGEWILHMNRASGRPTDRPYGRGRVVRAWGLDGVELVWLLHLPPAEEARAGGGQ
jgi:Dolichyl-phosphate-mannose-protein mannosyltransferase